MKSGKFGSKWFRSADLVALVSFIRGIAHGQGLADRPTLEAEAAAVAARFVAEAVPRPPHWGGYAVTPETVEFWQGRPDRLHDRLRYRREANAWAIERLAP